MSADEFRAFIARAIQIIGIMVLTYLLAPFALFIFSILALNPWLLLLPLLFYSVGWLIEIAVKKFKSRREGAING